MTVLLPETDEADLIKREEELRREEEASTAFLERLMKEAERIKDAETCPMI